MADPFPCPGGHGTDGTYSVRLVLRRPAPGTFTASRKTFVIASKPALVRVHLDKAPVRTAERRVRLKVGASKHRRATVGRRAM